MTATTTLKPPPADGYAHVVPLPTPPKAPDAMQQSPYITRAYSILETYFHQRPDVLVGSDGYLCYDTPIAPAGSSPTAWSRSALTRTRSWPATATSLARSANHRTLCWKWPPRARAGRTTPASATSTPSTAWPNTGGSTALAASTTTAPLSGDRLVNGRYEPLPLDTGADGVIRGYSPVLGPGATLGCRPAAVLRPGSGTLSPRSARSRGSGRCPARCRGAEALVERLRAQLRRLQSD